MLKKSLVVAGVLALSALAAPAHADNITSGDSSILGGNQVFAPISAPVNVCGVAVAVLGGAYAGCQGGAAVIR
ncbi:chaplin family protein [Nonomuraea sp. NBC_01738]|uniref:chaplin family protein n=1 Tax=Nonomuraea sp. NBC_01738 TaxID=2976003 RepID=UPI002E128740|nr:chaplin family protein [Nonomuraea sp. NBC_01738]